MNAPGFDLDRFVTAQAPVYADVCAELAAGRKTSHWMWFILPQLRVLGRSETARFYGIENLGEAAAYAAHALLGARLRECTQRVLDIEGRSVHQIFGAPDDLKLCSCMTLFERVPGAQPLFARVLARYYGGARDSLTLGALRDAGA